MTLASRIATLESLLGVERDSAIALAMRDNRKRRAMRREARARDLIRANREG